MKKFEEILKKFLEISIFAYYFIKLSKYLIMNPVKIVFGAGHVPSQSTAAKMCEGTGSPPAFPHEPSMLITTNNFYLTVYNSLISLVSIYLLKSYLT